MNITQEQQSLNGREKTNFVIIPSKIYTFKESVSDSRDDFRNPIEVNVLGKDLKRSQLQLLWADYLITNRFI